MKALGAGCALVCRIELRVQGLRFRESRVLKIIVMIRNPQNSTGIVWVII